MPETAWVSPDSDFDLRGAHLMPLRKVVSLFPARETIEYSAMEDGRQIDLVSQEAAKYFRLILKKNGYVLEQVFFPLVVVGGPLLEELREVARRCITRHLYHLYAGFAESQLQCLDKERAEAGEDSVSVTSAGEPQTTHWTDSIQ